MSRTVTLRNRAGTLTLTFDGDLFALTKRDRALIGDICRMVDEYEARATEREELPASPSGTSSTGGES